MIKPLLCLALTACSLTSRSRPVDVRYFSADTTLMSAPVRERTPPFGARPPRLRMGRVTAGAHLSYRIVHRRSPVELGIYDDLRWTERPDDYVRRALERELFEARPLVEAVSDGVPSLEVEVLAFEQVQRGLTSAGRVQLRYRLDGPEDVLASGVITVDRNARSAQIDDVVAAIGTALAAATSKLADEVQNALVEHPRSPENGSTTSA
ncbi:MAG TPA: ABC-type transport auxiliary lipoprotein family protein [Kofleriaceae bacterium]|nr:ABC-type transport auxiliary lipoprotein family protein [Kofleriaceae bacterium]